MNTSENYRKAIESLNGISIGDKFKKHLGKGKYKECYVSDVIVPFSVAKNDFYDTPVIYAQFVENTFNTGAFEVPRSTIKRSEFL